MSFFQEIKSNKISFLKTVLVSLLYMVIGLAMSIPGPTLLDLQIAVNCSLEEIGYLMPSRAFGYVIGSFAGGFIPEQMDKQPFIITCSVAVAALLGSLPWNVTHWVLILNGAFLGLFMGMIEVCATVFVLQLWGTKSPLFIQFMYFFYGLGAFAAPLLAEPFILPLKPDNSTEAFVFTRDDLKIHIPCGIVAIYSCVIAFIFGVIYFCKKESKPVSSVSEKVYDDSKSSKIKKTIAIIISMLFIKLYFGNAITFGSFLATFAVKCKLRFTKSAAAMLTSVFWGTFTFFRIPITLLMNFISLRNMIIFELLMILGGAIQLQIFGETSPEVLWVGVTFIGCGLSSVFSLTLGYLQQHFQLTNAILSLFMVSACLGEFLYPTVLAKFIDIAPNVFLILCSFCTVSSLIIFVILEIVCRRIRAVVPEKTVVQVVL